MSVTIRCQAMGRPEKRARERKRAAAGTHKLDDLFGKRRCSTERTESEFLTENSQGTSTISVSITATNHGDEFEGVAAEQSAQSEQISTTTTSAESIDQEETGRVADEPDTLPRLESGIQAAGTLSATNSPVTPDIGDLFSSCSSSEEFSRKALALSTSEKYALLKHHSVPSQQFTFPTTYTGGCNRAFHRNWLEDHPWMAYSTKVDGCFCVPCALFCNVNSQLVTRPFNKWQKKTERCREHERCCYHQDALLQAEHLISTIENPASSISALASSRRMANLERNRAILKTISRAVLFCGRQCIALRGDDEVISNPGNHGNFLSLLQLLSVYDDTLRSHLQSPVMRNATYISPRTQNEIIEVIGKHIILKRVLEEVKTARFFAVLADEVTSHNTEHIALCVRFVDSCKNIREDFLAFLPLQRITGEMIADAIISFLTENEIAVTCIRGQGYDGASNMSSSRIGVQQRVKEKSPLATYVHCSGHCLNLVITKSCSLPDIRNIIDRLQHCCRFFLNSPKRTGLLELIIAENVPHIGKRKPLLDLCKTRWAERHNAYQHFYQAFTYIVEALELIGYKRHVDKYGDLYADWDPPNHTEAQQIVASITSFSFIVGFLTVYQYLSHLAGITVKLQRQASDIIQAHQQVQSIITTYKDERRNVDRGFGHIFTHSERMAEAVGATVCMPRIAGRQIHRSNPQSSTPFDYFKRTIAIPFLNHIISSLEAQFSNTAVVATSLLGLVPSICSSANALN